uniref:Uncharacterized protein n=1 Tax=Anguilla anguilla TaxID=7936 RepID=A0A0E9QIB2_ANGAN
MGHRFVLGSTDKGDHVLLW